VSILALLDLHYLRMNRTRAYRMRLEEWGVKKNKSGGESTVSDRSSKRSARRGAFDDAASPKQGKGVNHISGYELSI
jgi:hypothetical protein